MEYFPLGMGLVVRQEPRFREIAKLLADLRRLHTRSGGRDCLVSMPEEFWERFARKPAAERLSVTRLDIPLKFSSSYPRNDGAAVLSSQDVLAFWSALKANAAARRAHGAKADNLQRSKKQLSRFMDQRVAGQGGN